MVAAESADNEALVRSIVESSRVAAQEAAHAAVSKAGADIAVLQSQMHTLILDGIEPRLREVENQQSSMMVKLDAIAKLTDAHLLTHSKIVWLIGGTLFTSLVGTVAALLLQLLK